ncbi:MAG: hypothetical protein RLY31_2033 [Bacteroidota bacterium]
MMSKFLCLSVVLLISRTVGLAQPNRAVAILGSASFAGHATSDEFVTEEADLPFAVDNPFLSYAVVTDLTGAENHLEWVFRRASGQTHPIPFRPDTHADKDTWGAIGRLGFLFPESDPFVSYHLRWTGTHVPPAGTVQLHFFKPGPTGSGDKRPPVLSQDPAFGGSACPCPAPGYENRLGWCPAGNCPPDPTPVPTQTGFLIVHHSAGSNSATDWAAVVRAIWDFHVNVNGWDDIGYNWLVDPNGVLYEGRGDNRLGAHFCGANGGTMGVCMLGDFTAVQPTAAARNTLSELLSWKACDAGLDPLGSAFHPGTGFVLPRISGHQDGCATACPGNQFYPVLSSLRQEVSDRIEFDCPVTSVNAPTLLTGILTGPDQAELLWSDNADNETAFVLERALGATDTFAILATLPPNTVGYYDLGLPAGSTLRYRVRALADNAASAYSNVVVLMTLTGQAERADGQVGEARLSVLPNPASSFLRLQAPMLSGPSEVEILDLTGKKMAHWPIVLFEQGLSSALSTAVLPQGHYRIRVWQQDQVLSAGFLKI